MSEPVDGGDRDEGRHEPGRNGLCLGAADVQPNDEKADRDMEHFTGDFVLVNKRPPVSMDGNEA